MSDRKGTARNAVMEIPISDFELSVRSRNCLKKMNIRSLGDLLKTSEQELLSYKNFGETSLNEIKALLASKGLRLGQNAEGGGQGGPPRRTWCVGRRPIPATCPSRRSARASPTWNSASAAERRSSV